jgi:hypothetical protein
MGHMVRYTGGAALAQPRTKIKVLNSPSIPCDVGGCGRKAEYLFRTESGPISAYCELHAEESAFRLDVNLPVPVCKMLRAG